MTKMPRAPRYRLGTSVYDFVSMERLFYRSGRRAAIDALGLTPGARVRDVGCGTGLNFPYVVAAVGATGELVGLDASPGMLRQAHRRVARHDWSNVSLVEHDAALLTDVVSGGFDAVLFTYSLSVIEDWRSTWDQAWALLLPGGRVAVVDTALPSGGWRLLSPLARLALFSGGVHASRQVWLRVLVGTEQTTHRVLTGGHVHVTAGTKPSTTVRVGMLPAAERPPAGDAG